MADPPEQLTLDLDGWEGPLDLLLSLARQQKVDLRRLSVLRLVDQYLAYLGRRRALQLDVAADYLVMAAWLVYLKSALLLPRDPEAQPDPEELALRLQLRLARLDAMRDAGARLLARDRLGRDVFARGAPEGLKLIRRPAWEASLYDLAAAYGQVKARTAPVVHLIRRRPVMTLDDALRLVGEVVGRRLGWTELASLLPPGLEEDYRRSAVAASFVAALELARQGRVALAQDGAFAPLMVRAA